MIKWCTSLHYINSNDFQNYVDLNLKYLNKMPPNLSSNVNYEVILDYVNNSGMHNPPNTKSDHYNNQSREVNQLEVGVGCRNNFIGNIYLTQVNRL